MRLPAGYFPKRTLGSLIVLGVCNHTVMSGVRVAVSLDALARGASVALVGVLLALFALLPMLFALPAGRLADRIGVRRPMLWGSIGCVVGPLLPAVWPGLPALFVCAALTGASFMLFQIPAQRTTGELGAESERTANFSWLALGYGASGFLGPLVAGFAIDTLGFGWAFVVLALPPLVPAIALAAQRLNLPAVRALEHAGRRGGALELLKLPGLRRILIINVAFALGWDLHTVFVPIYGSKIGLSAAQIGMILAAFAAATFVVRLFLPLITRRFAETKLMTAALFCAGAVFIAFPFLTSATALAAVSFVLGLALGTSQPMVLSQLHAQSPPGRAGEVVGIRMTLMQSMAVAVPLVFGAVTGAVGLLPVFWSVGLFIGGGGIYVRRSR